MPVSLIFPANFRTSRTDVRTRNRTTRGDLYILASAQSGSGKSETFRHFSKPLLDFEAQRHEAWQAKTLPELNAERAMEIVDWFAGQQLEILKAGRMERKLARVEKLRGLIATH